MRIATDRRPDRGRFFILALWIFVALSWPVVGHPADTGSVESEGADLSLAKRVNDSTPIIGSQVIFTLTIANAGPRISYAMRIVDSLPDGYTYVSHETTAGYYEAATGEWMIWRIDDSSTAELSLVVTVNGEGGYTNTAEITACAVPDPDSEPANGDPTEDDYAVQATTPRTDNVPPVIIGQASLSTFMETPLTIMLDDLMVWDPDDVYPEGFTLTVQLGNDYTVTGPGEITPDPGVHGDLAVLVTAHDGTNTSPIYDLTVTVNAAMSPNIVLIMLDDLDERTLGDALIAGLLPNLQTHIVDRALFFTESFVTNPLCCPSRACFLSGRYSHNHGALHNVLLYPDRGYLGAVGKFDDSDTVATRLRRLGYVTGHIGKYLNGYGRYPEHAHLWPAFDASYVPLGWHEWHATVDPLTYCVYDYQISHNGVVHDYMLEAGQTEDSALYQTHVLADIAESLVLDMQDGPGPFFLAIMPIAPHWEACVQAYDGEPMPFDTFAKRIRPAPEDKAVPVPPFLPSPAYDEDTSDKPEHLAELEPLTPVDFQNLREQYEGRIRSLLSVDRLIGRVVAALGSAIDETVLIFTSDNGWLYGEHRMGGKMLAYDEAARVPLYIRLPHAAAPETRQNLVINNDLAPTILDIASPGYDDADFDGRTLSPLLAAPEPPGWVERGQILIEHWRAFPGPKEAHTPTFSALRRPDTLYIESFGGFLAGSGQLIGLELYDVISDPHQLDSLLKFPQDPPDSVLSEQLALLKTCAAETCKSHENMVH